MAGQNQTLSTKHSILYVSEAPGLKMNALGCLQVSDIGSVRGAYASHYCRIGDHVIPMGDTQGPPEPLKVTIAGPYELLRSWLHRTCPVHAVVGFKKCQPDLRMMLFDDGFFDLLYLPAGELERVGLTTPATKMHDEGDAIIGAQAVLHVAELLHYEQHDAMMITAADVTCDVTALAFCPGACGALEKSCNEPFVRACSRFWVGGVGVAENGCLWYFDGATWTNKEGAGAGQIDLAFDADHYDVHAIFCDHRVVLVSDEGSIIHYSHNGGDTWAASADEYAVAKFTEWLGNYYAVGADGLLVSKDRGATWDVLVDAVFVDVDICADNGMGVAITATATYVTSDGVNWRAVTASGMAAQAKVDITPDGRIFVAGANGMIYTRDQGETWYLVDEADVCAFVFIHDFVGFRVLTYEEGNDHSLEVTLDGGYSWWPQVVHEWADEDLCELAVCDDRIMLGGTGGFLADRVLYDTVVADPGEEEVYVPA